MGTELIVPEITLIEKIQELDNTLSTEHWEQVHQEIALYEEEDEKLPSQSRAKRRMFFSDFVNKAVSLPIETIPQVSTEAQKELYRLHLFCCQQAVHSKEIRKNPLKLGYYAVQEMQLAFSAIFVSYRLTHPECPYSWTKEFFANHIIVDRGPDGHTKIKFLRPLDIEVINGAINEEIINDWLVYRAHDNNGIRTLVDFKNHLIDLPNFYRGGHPIDEFSRFERKLQEKRNKTTEKRNDELDLEFRKTLVKTAAEQAVGKMLSNGMSAKDLLNHALSGDLGELVNKYIEEKPEQTKELPSKKVEVIEPQKIEIIPAQKLTSAPALPKKSKKVLSTNDTEEIENIIAGFLDDNN